MKILLSPSIYLPSIGGVELNTHELARSLMKTGHEVVVVTSKWQQFKLPSHEIIDGVEVFRLPFYVFRGGIKSLVGFVIFFPIALVGTYRLVSKFKPDIINIHFVYSNALYMLAVHLIKKIPLVVTFHGNEVTNIPDPSAVGYTKTDITWMLRITDWLLRRASHVTAVSNHLIKSLNKVIPTISVPETAIVLASTMAKKVGKSEDSVGCPYILAVGRLAKQKGIDLLIEAFVPIAKENSRILLVVVGDGPARQAIEKQINAHDLVDRVRLMGALPKERIGPYYEHCLFVVVPSRWEGLPTVILEAFSYQKTVVATSVDAIPEMVTDGKTGLLVEPENITQLTDAIVRLFHDAKLREELGFNAKTFSLKLGGWDRVAEQYLAVYRKSLKASESVEN